MIAINFLSAVDFRLFADTRIEQLIHMDLLKLDDNDENDEFGQQLELQLVEEESQQQKQEDDGLGDQPE
ncbi:hypothetical protein GH714_015232 [Hevea brasiliensis]|uniref:Uncharacterized protein n=1 Tax=Hevea brasiliensis TaxID=3981 RepID=A0A6A6MDP5_HEVBR|nr:hypothetical protein GH714_015232 [Hevea brasiliensis]